MRYNTLSDMMDFICILKATAASVQVVDSERNQILYDSTQNIGSASVKGQPAALPNVNTGFVNGVSFSVSSVNSQASITTRIPVQIGAKRCHVVMVQRAEGNMALAAGGDGSQNHTIAFTDFLTQLYNRRYIDERLPLDMENCFATNRPLSLLFIDIDYFKTINDRNGHVAGDQVLQDTAVLLKRSLPQKECWIARYGGDEMLICLPGKGSYSARRTAFHIRNAMKDHIFAVGSLRMTITCSIGVQTVQRESGIHTASELIALADRRLYRAKASGRNQVF